MNFNDDGPTSLPFSLMPLRDSPALSNNASSGNNNNILSLGIGGNEAKKINTQNTNSLYLNGNVNTSSPSRSSR